MEKSKLQLNRENNKFFTKWSSSYDKGIIKYWLVLMQKESLKEIKYQNNLSILDLGCGTGQLLLELKNKFTKAKLFGLDNNESMLKVAKSKLKNVKLIKSSSDKIPLKNNSIDYVISTEAFHHFPEPEKTLLEMKRILKNNGKIIIIDINFGRIISHIFHKLEPGNYWIYSKKDFKRLFKKTNLKLTYQKRLGLFTIKNILEE